MVRQPGLLGSPTERQRQRLRGLLQAPTVDPAASTTQQILDPWQTDRGEAMPGAVHGRSFDQMTNDELRGYAQDRVTGNLVQRNIEMLSPSMIASLVFGGLEKSQLGSELASRGLSNPGDFVGGQISGAAGTGMNVAGGVANPELMGRSDPSQADITGANLGNGEYGGLGGNRDGGFAKGGVVRRGGLLGPNPPGPDEGFAALKGGERVLNEEQYGKLSPAAKKEIDALMRKTEMAKRR
jgi:hypothetical protein